jgi:hypothetical protein
VGEWFWDAKSVSCFIHEKPMESEEVTRRIIKNKCLSLKFNPEEE